MIRDIALLVLDRLERLEAQQLAWGLVDGGFSETEVYQVINEVLEELETDEEGLWIAAAEVLEFLQERVLLWRTPGHPPRYRSRSAEGVRLFARLRQMFKPEHWQSGPPLVSDFRYQVQPRRFPRREIEPEVVSRRIAEAVGLSDRQEFLLKRVLCPEGLSPVQLSEFQAQALEAILSGLSANQIGATVIAAGTGTGKTLAFLLPTLLHLVTRSDSTNYAKAIAVYPRNELLKDQIRAVLERVLPLYAEVRDIRGEPVSVGALFGSVPEDLQAVKHDRWGWERSGAAGRAGYVCPFVQCPKCNQELVWSTQDFESRSHALRCVSQECGVRIPDGVLRLTRAALRENPPDILFTSTEMMNRSLSDPRMRRLFGVGTHDAPRVLLLDEIHTYSGTHGAQVAVLLRRWRRLAKARPHVIGLSATLADASRFMSELTGVFEQNVRVVEPAPENMETQGAEYTLALRGDPVSETNLLSTTIQSAMLMGRMLDPMAAATSEGVFGSKLFAFGDNLDVINRLHDDLTDGEGFGSQAAKRALGSLANLRSPTVEPALPRWEAGQNWEICSDIGHPLSYGSRRRVTRVSSQDTGVDKGVSTVVATASLEVGFDDPRVGAVIQHKAPRDAAAYIQRRGRAGRSQVMRPWTVVVLSDYGRDRLAYQRYEDLFSPVVPAQFLPIHNPFVLKIQAGFALLDWIGERIPVPGTDSVFKLLAKPAASRSWYTKVAHFLLDVLTDPDAEGELRRYLQEVLEIHDSQAVEVMWTAPRSLMLEVIPTILRRIETNWHGEVPRERSPAPLPEFLPSALFADLNLPELAIRLPDGEPEQRMPFRQGITEFAPGRVSRRFGVAKDNLSHWVPVPHGGEHSEVVELAGVLDRSRLWELGRFQCGTREDGGLVRVIRPQALTVQRAPTSISSSSTAFLLWQTEIHFSSAGRAIRLPPAAAGRFRIQSIEGFLHSRGAPIEMRRFATAVQAETKPARGGKNSPPRRYGLTLDGEPIALGYSQPVDALLVRLALPSSLRDILADDQHLVRHLRVLRFHELMHVNEGVGRLANKFQVDWICDAVLATLGREALTSGRSVAEVANDPSVMGSDAWLASLRTIFDLDDVHQEARQADVDETEDGGSEAGSAALAPGGNRRFRDLAVLFTEPDIRSAIEAALPTLHQPLDGVWEPWLARVVHETMGAAVLSTVQSLLSDVSFDDLLVDVVPDRLGQDDSVPRRHFEIWVSEETPGGVGLVDRVESIIQEDPQRFLALLESSLETSDPEQAREDLGRVASWLAPASASYRGEVAEAAASLRAASSHAEEAAAFRTLRDALGRAGLFLHPVTLAAVNLRLLRPGSDRNTDNLYHGLYAEWEAAEARLGFEINPRVFAEIRSRDDAMDSLLESVTEGQPPESRRNWRFSVLNGLLWPARGTLRLEGLRYYNPFTALPTCDRLIVKRLITGDIPSVDVTQEGWRERLATAARQLGTVDLQAPTSDAEALSAALLSLAAEPLDVGSLGVFPRVRGFSQAGGSRSVRIEVPELFGTSHDG